ncbi:MAG: hypothetical protein ACI9DC_002274 [Gammaproteobacteria bacterium]|jgi:hypothetical protein
MSALGFSAPWVLLASLAMLVPIVAHLSRQEDREGRGFPSLMFLRRVPFPIRARRKLTDLMLLALRLLAILLLVLAFAQPYLLVDKVGADTARRARVVLLDRSASMAVGDRFAQARRVAEEALRADGSGTQIALVTFDETAHTLSGFADDPGAALQALRAVRPGNRSSDLSKALNHAARILTGTTSSQREVILISDLQRTALGLEPALANGVELQVKRIDEPVRDNLALLGVRFAPEAGSADAAVSLHVLLANTGSANRDSSLRLLVDGLPGAQRLVSLSAGERREVVLPVFAARERPTRVRLNLEKDALAIDNARYLVIAPPRPINVLWVADSSRGNFFVNAALWGSSRESPQRSLVVRGSSVQVNNVEVTQLQSQQIEDADVIVLDGVVPADTIADAIAQRVANGGGLLTVMRDGTAVQPTAMPRSAPQASALSQVVAGMLRTPRGTGAVVPTLFSTFNSEHVIAQALGDASFAGIPVWHYRSLEARRGDDVLMRFQHGIPAVLAREHGRGRSMTLAFSLQSRSSGLVLDPIFVPFIAESLLHLSQHRTTRLRFEPGDVFDASVYADAVVGGEAVTLALRAGEAVQLRSPSGVVQETRDGEVLLLNEVGFYELSVPNAPPLPVSVNPVAVESLFDAFTAEQFLARVHRLDTSASVSAVTDGTQWRDERIAQWLLRLAVFTLLAEALLAAWLARRRAKQSAAQRSGVGEGVMA